MEKKMNGLSLELIIHPGETISEILIENDMSQEELAKRSGVSAKHISEVVNGKKGISPKFAKSLEYVFGVPASFWINLQGIYDKELIELEEQNNITSQEISIMSVLSDIVEYFCGKKIIKSKDKKIQVLEMRKLMNVNNLENMSKIINYQVAYRGSDKYKVDKYVLYAWQKLCEIETKESLPNKELDLDLLQKSIPNIKKLMGLDPNDMRIELKKIFDNCGISFEIVKHFKGAPVNGFIQNKNNKIILCMTIRQSFADIFWFTLFHEIGHLINNDIKDVYFDYFDKSDEAEIKADKFAKNALIDEIEFEKFLISSDYSEIKIKEFALQQNVEEFIVIGRLQKELNDYSFMARKKLRYKWSI